MHGPQESQGGCWLDNAPDSHWSLPVPRIHRLLLILCPTILQGRLSTIRSNQENHTLALGQSTTTSLCQDPPSKHLKHDDILNIICQASKWDLTTSGNAAYMQLELALAHVANEKTQLEGLKQSLEEEVIRLQLRLQTIEPCSCAVSHRPFLPLASHFGSHAMLHFSLIHSNWCLSTTHNSQSGPSPQARILTSASRN